MCLTFVLMAFSRDRAARNVFPARFGNARDSDSERECERRKTSERRRKTRRRKRNGAENRGEIPCFRERRVRLRFDERTDPPTAFRVSADFRNRNCMSNPRNIVYIRICILRNVLHFSGVGIGTAQGFPVRARGRRHRYARGARRRPKSRYATTNKVIAV